MVVHRIKRVEFLGRIVPILCQNENGPCPLLAICNGLLLRGSISLPAGRMEVRTEELVQLIANHLFVGNASQQANANIRKSLDDVIEILPGLQVGLDLNLKFTGVDSFEFTRQLATFDLAGLRLVHGWTYDPQDSRTAAAIGNMSYNMLIERVVNLRIKLESGETLTTPASEKSVPNSNADEARVLTAESASGSEVSSNEVHVAQIVSQPHVDSEVIEGKAQVGITCDAPTFGVPKAPESHENARMHDTLAALEDFLDSTRTQLSYHGLAKLHEFVRENEVCVFFRNNHFSTMFKHEGSLYLLLTDIGYEHRSEYVWERLTEIDGDTMCCNAKFKRSMHSSTEHGVSVTHSVSSLPVEGTVVGVNSHGTSNFEHRDESVTDGPGVILSGTIVDPHSQTDGIAGISATEIESQRREMELLQSGGRLGHDTHGLRITEQDIADQRAELDRLKMQQRQQQKEKRKRNSRNEKREKGSCVIS